MDKLESELYNLKNGNIYNDFCLNDALQHLDKIKEALAARENDPQKYYKESIEHSKWLLKVMPILYLLDAPRHHPLEK